VRASGRVKCGGGAAKAVQARSCFHGDVSPWAESLIGLDGANRMIVAPRGRRGKPWQGKRGPRGCYGCGARHCMQQSTIEYGWREISVALREEKPLQWPEPSMPTRAGWRRPGLQALYFAGGGWLPTPPSRHSGLGISTMEDCADRRAAGLRMPAPAASGRHRQPAGVAQFNIARLFRSMIKARRGGGHIEDQVGQKRCGHRPGKELVPAAEMWVSLQGSVDAAVIMLC